MRAQQSFPAVPASAREVRRFVGAVLSDLVEDVADSVLLMAAELAANCIVHAGSPFSVTISRLGDQLRIEMTDQGGGSPDLRRPGPLEPHGRGLQIVDAIADDWGVTHRGASSKTVWFSVQLGAVSPRLPGFQP